MDSSANNLNQHELNSPDNRSTAPQPDRRAVYRTAYAADRRSAQRTLRDELVIGTTQTLDEVIGHSDATPIPLWGRFAKRALDIVAVSFALLVLSPLLALVALAIRLDSPGPIFFSQNRVTKDGRIFKMWKFRSMVVNAEALKAQLEAQNEMSGAAFKIKHDPRITRLGRFIRKHSIDELPQLWNVLTGDLTLVGPRPALLAEIMKYREWQAKRMTVTAGLTCIWQVSGRNQILFDDWMRLDIRYIDNWSLWLDIKLIFLTIKTVITGHGAS